MARHTTRLFFTLSVSCALIGCQGAGPRSARTTIRPAAVTPQQAAVADALVDEGHAQREQGNVDEAIDAFSQAIEENPMLTEAHLGMGDVFREQGVYENASAAYRQAIVTDPNNFDARYYFGLTHQLRGMLDEAIASYQRALVIDPDNFAANREMGSAHLQAGDPDAAIPFARKAIEIDPESQSGWANLAAAYSLVGDYSGAIEAYRQTLELGEPAEPILLGLADAHIRMGNFQRAENVLRATLRTGSGPIGYERLGYVLFKQSRFEDALSAYNEALHLAPEDTASLNGSGVCLMAMYLQDGEYNDELRVRALTAWRRSLELRPGQNNLIDLIARYSKE